MVPASAVMASTDVTKEDDGIGDEDWNMLAANAGFVSLFVIFLTF